MRGILKAMRERLASGESVALVTITAATGATPRGAGARMLVGRQGRICGTIGGGAVEYRAEQTAMRTLEDSACRSEAFSLNRDDVQNLGMICGGDVNVFFQPIPAGDADVIALADEAEAVFRSGEALWLISNLSERGTLSLYTQQRGVFGPAVPPEVLAQRARKLKQIEHDGAVYCIEQISRPGKAYIFGCGHVSRELQPVLSHLDFRCVMLDDRPEFARKEFFPTAEDVRVIDFARIGDFISIGPEDYVCIMTRGHAHDTVIQAQVLRQCPRYVGVIGSRKKAAGVRQALKEQFGLTENELSRITTPIGLPIRAETPAEIAISVAAQMIQVRAQQDDA